MRRLLQEVITSTQDSDHDPGKKKQFEKCSEYKVNKMQRSEEAVACPLSSR